MGASTLDGNAARSGAVQRNRHAPLLEECPDQGDAAVRRTQLSQFLMTYGVLHGIECLFVDYSQQDSRILVPLKGSKYLLPEVYQEMLHASLRDPSVLILLSELLQYLPPPPKILENGRCS